MSSTYRSGNWELTVDQDFIDVTSERATPNEQWRFTDTHGHEHHYDRGYPTLDEVIDAQHWCDGREGIYNHDPHWAIDASHFECKLCREIIEPTLDPPYTPKRIPGLVDATLTGTTTSGEEIVMGLTHEELDELRADSDVGQRLLDNAPADRIISRTFRSR